MTRKETVGAASSVVGSQEPMLPTTREAIAALFARRQAAWDRLDVRALAADYAENCVVETPWAGTLTGRSANEEALRTLFGAFPDLQLRTERLVIDGNEVAQVFTVQGTDLGGFMGLGPTGKAFLVPGVLLYSLESGQIVRERRIYDFTGMLVQIGVLKAKPV